MALRFHWEQLDALPMEALRMYLTETVRQRLRLRGLLAAPLTLPAPALPTGAVPAPSSPPPQSPSSGGGAPIRHIEVTGLSLGDVPPYIEIVALDDAIDLGDMPPALSCPPHPGPGTPHQTSGGTAFSTGSHASSSNASAQRSSGATTTTSTAAAAATARTHHDLAGAFDAVPDALAHIVGERGLFAKFRVAYGGNMCLRVDCVLSQALPLGLAVLPAALPCSVTVSSPRLDMHVCVNLHRNRCAVWLEPGAEGPVVGGAVPSPLQDVIVELTLGAEAAPAGGPPGTHDAGGDRGRHDDDDDLFTYAAPVWPQHSSGGQRSLGSSVAVPHAESHEDCVFADRALVSDLVLGECRAAIRHALLAPRFLSFPIHAGGTPSP